MLRLFCYNKCHVSILFSPKAHFKQYNKNIWPCKFIITQMISFPSIVIVGPYRNSLLVSAVMQISACNSDHLCQRHQGWQLPTKTTKYANAIMRVHFIKILWVEHKICVCVCVLKKECVRLHIWYLYVGLIECGCPCWVAVWPENRSLDLKNTCLGLWRPVLWVDSIVWVWVGISKGCLG